MKSKPRTTAGKAGATTRRIIASKCDNAPDERQPPAATGSQPRRTNGGPADAGGAGRPSSRRPGSRSLRAGSVQSSGAANRVAGPSEPAGATLRASAATPLPYGNRRLREARILAGWGVPEEGIASYFGISRKIFEEWKCDHPELVTALRWGQKAHAAGIGRDPRWSHEALGMLASRAAREEEASQSAQEDQLQRR
jgi:hypothetical protein